MIDWLTLSLDIPEYLWDRANRYIANNWAVQKINQATGEVAWSAPCRESIRSDSHQIVVQVTGSRITISGSPARSMGQTNNVFGSSDLIECAKAHVRVARQHLPFPIPSAKVWRVQRVDVTHNYDFGSPAEVRQALGYLRQYDGGRYRLDTRRGDTVYWSPTSSLRKGKAYHKGPHLRHQIQKDQAKATDQEIALADRLLRLELTLGAEWWGRLRREGKRPWDVDLEQAYKDYWEGLIGKVEVVDMNELELIKQVKLKKGQITEGQALQAYRTWCLVKSIGHRETSESMARATWYLHKKILFAAGLSWGDLAAGQIIPFRRRSLVIGQPVQSWDELRRAA